MVSSALAVPVWLLSGDYLMRFFKVMFVTAGFLGLSASFHAGDVPLGAEAVETPLAAFFGFDELEVVKIGRDAGPALVADMNGNGLMDLVVVNNHASRIEIHYQKEDATPGDAAPPSRVNEFPEHWRFKRENVSVTHRVTGIVAHDFNSDGRMDLIYAGHPGEIVFVRQTQAGRFEVTRRHRVRNLATTRRGFALADVLGESAGGPELLALAGGEIHIWPLEGDGGDMLGQPQRLSAGANIGAFVIADLRGDGANDVAALVPDDPAPLRIWFGARDGDGRAQLGPQKRYEMPAIRTMEVIELDNHDARPAARLAVIESASKRLVIYEAASEPIPVGGHREGAFHVHGFTDPGSRKRSVAVIDIDGDGLLDVLSTDVPANAVVWYRQIASDGIQPGRSFPSLSELDAIAAARRADESGYAEMFVLSEREAVVGRSEVGPDGIAFPQPLAISQGATPVAMSLVELDGQRHVAVVTRDGRDHKLELLNVERGPSGGPGGGPGGGARREIPLGGLARSPETIVALDADQDGRTDLLLFTRDRPMTMLLADPEHEHGYRLLESTHMGQFGLVQAARAENTAVFDINGNGMDELLIADRNYVRAVRYEANPAPGVSPGWQVVQQINASDPSSRLVAVTVLGSGSPPPRARGSRIIAADRENDRLVVFAQGGVAHHADSGLWTEIESIGIRGFGFTSIHAGSFAGDGEENILAIGSDGFAVVRLGGERLVLRETDAWRTTDERQLHFELAGGDVNGDGFTDLIAIDAGEQICDIFTFTETGRLLHATGFKIYESRIFARGQAREFQPNQAIIADVTGDGADDLILISHDRVLIYPQMTVDREERAQTKR
jgi:hypothetical protein